MSPFRTSPLPSLGAAGWLAWPGTVEIFAAFEGSGHDVRAVGGAVRDTLLGRAVEDVDFATTAPPGHVMELAAAAGLKTVPTGLDHGTVTVVAGGKGFEVTTLRRDVETYGRRAKVAYTGDWKADAGRRDFTINALYAGADGAVFDPLGVIGDIAERRVRFIGDAHARVREDYLRILRFFRFNAELGPEYYDETGLRACVREHAGLRTLSGERVRGELARLLAADGAARALWKMFDYGLLGEVLGGVAYLVRFERLAAIEAGLGAAPDALLRLCALGVAVEEDAKRLSENLRLANAERTRLEQAAWFRSAVVPMGDRDVARLLYRYGRAGARDAALMGWAISGAGAEHKDWRGVLDRIGETPVPVFPLKGADIVKLGVPPGEDVGEILHAIEAHWLEDGCMAGKAGLMKLARELAAAKGGHA